MAEFGFIIAATLGATAGTTDLADGMFRHLVITGRSRLALYLARIPAGLSIVLPLVAVAFAIVCLVTSFAGTPQPASIGVNGISVPAQLSQAQLKSWILQHPQQYDQAFVNGGPQFGPAPGAIPVPRSANPRPVIDRDIATIVTTPPRRPVSSTRRSTRWSRSGCGSSSTSASGSWSVSASAPSSASAPCPRC
jgi:hypothetical protein